jgi:hypothetical protein
MSDNRENRLGELARHCAREGLQSTPNHPPPAKQIKKNPLANLLLTKGSLIGEEARQASALPPIYASMIPAWVVMVFGA